MREECKRRWLCKDVDSEVDFEVSEPGSPRELKGKGSSPMEEEGEDNGQAK